MNTLDYETLLSQVESYIHFTASRYKHLADIEDLEQEARVQIWQAWQRINNADNPIGYTKGVVYSAIVRTVADKPRSVKAESLEAYLCWQEDDGEIIQRDIPALPNPKRLASKTVRHHVLSALDRLSQKQRRAVMAYYRIENRQGRVSERRKTRQEEQARHCGIVRLRKVLSVF